MFGILETILAFVIIIGVLVFIHELGHFLAARWCGMRADVFAIGMGPRVMGWNKITGFSFGKLPEDIELGEHTDYRLAAFPIGGYVKILGMVDESMDTEFASRPPQPWEFRSKPAWQKAFVLSAGVIMNAILAILVYGGLLFFYGEQRAATTDIGALPSQGASEAAYEAGLREGDRIVSINGDSIRYWEDIAQKIYVDHAGDDLTFKVMRNGAEKEIVMPRENIPADIQNEGIIIPYAKGIAIHVQGLESDSPAEEAGILPGDTIVALDGVPVTSQEDFIAHVKNYRDRKIDVEIARADGVITKAIQPSSEGTLGIHIQGIYRGPTERITYGIGAALEGGVKKSWRVVEGIANLIGDLFSGKQELKNSVGGPVMIFKAAGQMFRLGVAEFFGFMAYLSMMLAVMNILPLPALDGGHLVFVGIEAIMRREVPIKVRMAVQQVGFFLFLAFIIFVTYNDITR